MRPVEFAPSPASVTTIKRREKLPSILTPVLPYEIIHQGPGLVRAEALLNQTPPWGLVVAFNHYSLRDFADLARSLATSPVVRERPVLIPIAFHQYNPLIAKVGEYFDFNLRPIVIRDTLARRRYQNLPQGQGLGEYVRDAAKVLAAGGIVPISLQEGRRPKLGTPEVPTLSFFWRRMERKGVARLAILFVGLGLVGETDYSRPGVDKFNFGPQVEVKFGETFTREEALAGSRASQLTLDEWAYTQMAPLVPAVYR